MDSRLQVLGTEKLRVADASVMPSKPSGNSHTTIIMIAEKAADIILESARKRYLACRIPAPVVLVVLGKLRSLLVKHAVNICNIRHVLNVSGVSRCVLHYPHCILNY